MPAAPESSTSTALTEDAVRTALRAVVDPELGENIVDLGLIERVEIDTAAQPPRLAVMLILTSATCPMGDVMLDDAEAVLRKHWPQIEPELGADLTISWSPERMAPALRVRFGW